VYRHIKSIPTSHPGIKGIRRLRATFQVPGKEGPHECLVHDPLAITLGDIKAMSENEKLSPELLKSFTLSLLQALDFLHTEAKVVHTGMWTKIILTPTDIFP
jgi:serine/threonine-protein kinase SRPK3